MQFFFFIFFLSSASLFVVIVCRFWHTQKKKKKSTHLSLKSRIILSLLTLSFLEMTFFRWSIVWWCSTTTSKLLPVVGEIFNWIVWTAFEELPRPAKFWWLELWDMIGKCFFFFSLSDGGAAEPRGAEIGVVVFLRFLNTTKIKDFYTFSPKNSFLCRPLAHYLHFSELLSPKIKIPKKKKDDGSRATCKIFQTPIFGANNAKFHSPTSLWRPSAVEIALVTLFTPIFALICLT